MKLATLLSMIFVSYFAFSADTLITVNGTQTQFDLTVDGPAKYSTQYYTEQVQSTCYREEFSHYDYEYYTEPRYHCYRTPVTCTLVCNAMNQCRKVCTGGEYKCTTYYESFQRQVPRYRTVSYPCVKDVQRSRQIFEYDTKADIKINISLPEMFVAPSEAINVSFNGTDVILSVKSRGELIAIESAKKITSHFSSPSLKIVEAEFNIDFKILKEFFKGPHVITDASYSDGVLRYNTGTTLSDYATQTIKIRRKNGFIGTSTIFDKTLIKGEFDIEKTPNGDYVVVDFRKLGIEVKNRKHTFHITSNLQLPYKIITSSPLIPKLEVIHEFVSKKE